MIIVITNLIIQLLNRVQITFNNINKNNNYTSLETIIIIIITIIIIIITTIIAQIIILERQACMHDAYNNILSINANVFVLFENNCIYSKFYCFCCCCYYQKSTE